MAKLDTSVLIYSNTFSIASFLSAEMV